MASQPLTQLKGITMINALLNLILSGDYAGTLRPLLGEEDSQLVGSILSLTGR